MEMVRIAAVQMLGWRCELTLSCKERKEKGQEWREGGRCYIDF
jgi:hypothetical protein